MSIEEGQVTDTKPEIDQEDVTEFRGEIDWIDFTGTNDVP